MIWEKTKKNFGSTHFGKYDQTTDIFLDGLLSSAENLSALHHLGKFKPYQQRGIEIFFLSSKDVYCNWKFGDFFFIKTKGRLGVFAYLKDFKFSRVQISIWFS